MTDEKLLEQLKQHKEWTDFILSMADTPYFNEVINAILHKVGEMQISEKNARKKQPLTSIRSC